MSASPEPDAGCGGRLAERLLLEEVVRIVTDAKDRGETLRAGYHAASLFAAYPYIFSIGRIVDVLIVEAAKQGVPVEICRI